MIHLRKISLICKGTGPGKDPFIKMMIYKNILAIFQLKTGSNPYINSPSRWELFRKNALITGYFLYSRVRSSQISNSGPISLFSFPFSNSLYQLFLNEDSYWNKNNSVDLEIFHSEINDSRKNGKWCKSIL